MAAKGLKIRGDNSGLTVSVNLWSLKNSLGDFNSEMARLWVKGTVRNAETQEHEKFNDAGELITILGKWNAKKFRELRKNAKRR